ncbi:MAG TPA: hypothetical protein DCX61_00415, partial [Gemmatimonadetes bacterium]|nr:hypothetical protein [Gemmatimonadota bacterium]
PRPRSRASPRYVYPTLSDRATIGLLLAFVTKREEIARFAKVIGKKAEEDAVIWIGLRFGFGAPSS